MQEVGLSYLDLESPIFTLSGGEAQRVSIAKLMLKKPRILLADEPTASLDPETAEELIELLLQMRSEDRVIIIATHNPSIWARVDEVVEISGFSHKHREL